MHLQKNDQFGFNQDTFVGLLPQKNDWYKDWLSYYKEQRLTNQLKIAIKRGRMPFSRRECTEKIIDNLDRWITHRPDVSLLHGDLWGGNWLVGPEGKPYLIDPSVFYGDHAFELAFTELFGGFPPQFYDAYQEVYPLPENYEEIKPLYQLYYLLVHLNIFGESYGGAVDRILKRYC